MSVHARKAKSAGEPLAIWLDKPAGGSEIHVSPIGGGKHGAYFEAFDPCMGDDVVAPSVAVPPEYIISVFTAGVAASGYTPMELQAIAFESGIVADADVVAERLRGARQGVSRGVGGWNLPYVVEDPYGDKLIVDVVESEPGKVGFTFSPADGVPVRLAVPPDRFMVLFSAACRATNYTEEELRALAVRAGVVKQTIRPNNRALRRSRARRGVDGSLSAALKVQVPGRGGSVAAAAQQGSAFFKS